MNLSKTRLGMPMEDISFLRERASRLGVVTEPMAAVGLLPVLVTLLASTADLSAVTSFLLALGLVFYQASVAMGGRYIV